MTIEQESPNNDLCFVSMPKAGTNWFKHLAEYTLKRGTVTNRYSQQCINALYYSNLHDGSKNWGIHYHGLEKFDNSKNFNCRIVEPQNKKILFLSREFKYVIYSWIMFSKLNINEEQIKTMMKFLTEYYNHFTTIQDKELYCFTYEDMVEKPMEILPSVFDFIGVDYDINRLA